MIFPVRPRVREWLKAIGIGLAAGWLIYGASVAWAYARIAAAVSEAKLFPHLYAEDPTLPVVAGCEGADGEKPTARMTRAELFRLMQVLGLLGRDAEAGDISREILRAHDLDGSEDGVSLCVRATELLLRLSLDAGRNTSAADEGGKAMTKQEIARARADGLAAWMADLPGAGGAFTRAEGPPGSGFSLRYFWPVRTESWGPRPELNRVLSALFDQSRAPDEWKDHLGKDSERTGYRDQIVGYSRHVSIALERDPQVQWSRYLLSIVQGPEQLVMWLLFAVAVSLMIAQHLGRLFPLPSPSSHGTLEAALADLEIRRAPLRWCLRALPSVGFIGTVRGLSAALGDADLIVSASTKVEQAAAISDVATTLGLAFTTTMVALIFGLFGTLLEMALESREQRLVSQSFLKPEVAAPAPPPEMQVVEGGA